MRIEVGRAAKNDVVRLKASPGNYLMGPTPKLSQNWSVPFSPRAVSCCAMDGFTGLARITNSDHPRNLGFTSTELPNEQWQRWPSQRASLSSSTEHATALDKENHGSAQ